MDIYKLHMGPAKCALDMGDGSERGEYVSQDYLLHLLGRPHRAINLMFTYYPLDEGWPARARTLPRKQTVDFAWGYAYDDYFPYTGGLEGDTTGEPFVSIRDIRSHGQDVILTITVDCAVDDARLIKITEDLRPFGRLMLRINHEAMGNWFAFNKRYTYKEVADFYTRFHRIIKKHAPNIQTILCIGDLGLTEEGKMRYEDDFVEAMNETDIWSNDTYLSLHWGWPHSIAEPGGGKYHRNPTQKNIDGFKKLFDRFMLRTGGKQRPFVVSEINADGDVNGPYEQADQIKELYDEIPKQLPFLTGITYYQFRDRGRLGLEIQDPNNAEVGVAQPVLEVYKEIVYRDYYMPKMDVGAAAQLPVKLRWGGSEDSDGIVIPIKFEADPVFCEVSFDGDDADLNIMMEINGRWFHKKPGVKKIDMISAFFNKRLPGPATLEFKLFAPPPNGTNDPSQGDDWDVNYYAELKALPEFRIRYEPAAR